GDNQPLEEIKTSPNTSSTQAESQIDPVIEEQVITQETEEAPVIKKETNTKENTTPVKEIPKEEVVKKDQKPDKSTTDALTSIIDGPKKDGKAAEGEGDDNQAGDKGNPDGDPNSNSYYGVGVGLDRDGNYLLGG